MAAEAESRRVFRVFWAWQDEEEERWLRDMARQGWHLRSAGIPIYTFERGDAADVVYRLDYRIVRRGERAEYDGLFRSAGWEPVCELANWHYFRTAAAAGSDPEIFSDTESRVAKYRRLLAILLIFLPVFTTAVINLARRPALHESPLLEGILTGGTIAYACMIALWSYAVVRIGLHIRHLRQGR